MTREWLSTSEVAAQLGRGRDYVLGLLELGSFEGAYRTPGGHWKIPAEAVPAFLDRMRKRVIRRRKVSSTSAIAAATGKTPGST